MCKSKIFGTVFVVIMIAIFASGAVAADPGTINNPPGPKLDNGNPSPTQFTWQKANSYDYKLRVWSQDTGAVLCESPLIQNEQYSCNLPDDSGYIGMVFLMPGEIPASPKFYEHCNPPGC